MKNLASLQLSKPSSSTSTSKSKNAGRVGSLKTKHRSYNLVEAGHTSKIKTAINSEGRDPTSGPSAVDVMRMDVDKVDEEDLRREGGEEMQGMSLMVPRFSKKGKLFVGESDSEVVSHPTYHLGIVLLHWGNANGDSSKTNLAPSRPGTRYILISRRHRIPSTTFIPLDRSHPSSTH